MIYDICRGFLKKMTERLILHALLIAIPVVEIFHPVSYPFFQISVLTLKVKGNAIASVPLARLSVFGPTLLQQMVVGCKAPVE